MPRCGVRLLCWRARQKLCSCCSREVDESGRGGFEDPVDDWEVDDAAAVGPEVRMKRLSAARRRYEQAIEKRTEHRRDDGDPAGGDLAALTAKFRLAGCVDDMGEWREARQLYEEVIQGRREKLGPRHTDTLDAQWYLAMLLIDDPSQWGSSRSLWSAIAGGYAETHGKAHQELLHIDAWGAHCSFHTTPNILKQEMKK